MRFNLFPKYTPGALLPFIYYYQLSSAILWIIKGADTSFDQFLQKKDTVRDIVIFKVLTLADMHIPFVRHYDRMHLANGEAALSICRRQISLVPKHSQ